MNKMEDKQRNIAEDIYKRIAQDRAVLLSAPTGTGKTRISSHVIHASLTEHGKKAALVIAKCSTVKQWIAEVNVMFPGQFNVVHFPQNKSKRLAFMIWMDQSRKPIIVVVSKTTLREAYTSLRPIPWACVVVDEIHEHLNLNTLEAKALLDIPCIKLGMSATLTKHKALDDLKTLCRLVDHRFVFDESKTTVKSMSEDYVMSYTKEDLHQRSKEIIYRTEYVSMDYDEFEMYLARMGDMESSYSLYCSAKVNQAAPLSVKKAQVIYQASITNLRTAGIFYPLGQVKKTITTMSKEDARRYLKDEVKLTSRLRRVLQIMEQHHEQGQRLLVFSEFSVVIRVLSAHFQRPHSVITGESKTSERTKIIQEWRHSEDQRVMLLTTRAAGTGINQLEVASKIVMVETPSSPSMLTQAIGRSDRVTNPSDKIEVTFVCAPGTDGCLRWTTHKAKENHQNMVSGNVDHAPDIPVFFHVAKCFKILYIKWMEMMIKTMESYQRAIKNQEPPPPPPIDDPFSSEPSSASLPLVLLPPPPGNPEMAFNRNCKSKGKNKKRKADEMMMIIPGGGDAQGLVDPGTPAVDDSLLFDYYLWLKEQVVTPELCQEMRLFEQTYMERRFLK